MAKYIAVISPEHNEVIFDISSMYTVTGSSVTMNVSVSGDSRFENYIKGYDSDSISSPAHLFINGVRYKKNDITSITSNVPPFIFSVRIDTDSELFATGAITLSFSGVSVSPAGNNEIIVQISDSDIQNIDDVQYEAKQLDSKLESYMLMRTNPKLAGNIKLVVDSKYHLYLDTFKVSNKLNDRIYRKFPVSAEGNYPHDVMTVFSNLPKSELFKLPVDSLNPHKFFNDYKNQYLTEYEYGAETNSDNLYSENMKILAPLHIGKNIPDYFCIFRYDGTFNEETYNSVDIDDNNKFSELIKTSKVVKIFDLRNYTTIGQYLNNYKNIIKDFLYGSCYMQFIEQDNEKYGENYRQGNNSWRGIDVAKGIITNKIETSYFANNVLSKEDGVQELFDDYIINGYERNNVLYPYILNLEFMFNDKDTEEFSMHRYFGLYLSSNDFLKYECIIKDNSKNNGVVYKLDENDNNIDDNDILNSIFVDKYKDRIFFMSTNNDAVRIQNVDDVKKFVSEYVCNNPDKNIANIKAEEINWHKDEKSFITMTFDSPIKYGEHLRFIGLDVYNQMTKRYENICLELVASNDKRLINEDDFISPYINTNSPDVYNSSSTNLSENNIYRLAFYTQDVTDETKQATLVQQFERIKKCIEKFDSFITFESANENTIGLTSSHNNVYFQHIARMNEYKEPIYEKLYLESVEGGKYKLHYTGNANIIDEPNNYIEDLKESMGSLCETVSYTNESYIVENKFYSKDEVNNVATYVNYRDDNNSVEDTIHYYSKSYTSYMHPLTPDSYYFHNKYAVFSTFGYDILGWRYNNIVKFKNVDELQHSFVIYSDIEDLLKVVKHPIVKTIEQTFESINKINVTSGYLTDNILIELGLNVYTQKLITVVNEYNCVTCPYNVDKSMIDFQIRPLVHNCEMNVFNPESASLSVMGIFNIKDLDMSVDLDQSKIIKNTQSINIPAGDIIYIDGRSDSRISRNVLYQVNSGAFNEFGAYKFVIIGNTLYYTNKKATNNTNNVLQGVIHNGCLTAASDMNISVIDTNVMQKYDFVSDIPTHLVENYFTNKKDIKNSNLSISVVPQVNMLWESNGLYFDGNSVLNIKSMLNLPYKQNGYITEHTSSHIFGNIDNVYSKNSVDSWARIGDNVYSFRELITKSVIKNPIRKMLIQNNNISTAVGYYNSYVQSLEFVYYGIKYTLKFDSEYYTQNLQMGLYNNFEIFVINEYDVTKNNEMFISVDEEIILIINHQFNMYDGNSKYSQIKQIYGDLTGYVDYSVYKAPYSIYSNSICGIPNVMNGYKSSDFVVKKENNVAKKYYYQVDRAQEKFKNNTAILPNSFYFDYDYVKENKKLINVDGTKVGILNNTAANVYSMVTFPYENTHTNILNDLHRTENSYIISTYNNEVSTYNTENILNRYMNSFNSNFDCHIINNEKCESITITDTYKPISMSVAIPNYIKYNFGYFVPRTYSIVEFNTNDYELIDTLGMSMLLGNTKIKNINRINCYTGNKVFNGTTNVDKNYFIINNKSILSSNWDRNYYRSYNTDNQERYKYINGYLPGIEDKSFFGSRCMTLKNDYILLDDFSNTRANSGAIKKIHSSNNLNSKNTQQNEITINITQSMYSLFQNNSIFTANWNGLSTNTDTSMKNYIKNSISEIFNAQRTKEVILYYKIVNNVEDMKVEYAPVDNLKEWNILENYKTDFSINNNDIMVTITIPDQKHIIIHPQIKIYRN